MSSDEVELIGDNEIIIEVDDDDNEEDVLVVNSVAEDADACVDNKTNICIVINDEHKESPVIVNRNSEKDSVANLKDVDEKEIINLDSDSAVSEKTNNNTNKTKIKQQQIKRNRKRRIRGRKGNNGKTTPNVDRGIQVCNEVLNASTLIENDNNIQNTVMPENECNISDNEGLSTIKQNEKEPTNSTLTPPPTVTTRIHLNNFDFSKLKWLKPLKSISSPPHLQIVIIDRSNPDWRITNDKWLMIEKRLLEALNGEMLRTNDASIGLFDGAKWLKGIKIVGCHNKNAFNFVTKFISNLDKLWCGANLDVFPITHISRHIVKAYIPPPKLNTQVILSLIRLQNASLCCEDWKVLRERERGNSGGGGVDIWFSINDESFTDLCRLRGEIKFGINRIFFRPSD